MCRRWEVCRIWGSLTWEHQLFIVHARRCPELWCTASPWPCFHHVNQLIDITWQVPPYPAQCEHQGHVTCIHSPLVTGAKDGWCPHWPCWISFCWEVFLAHSSHWCSAGHPDRQPTEKRTLWYNQIFLSERNYFSHLLPVRQEGAAYFISLNAFLSG